MDFDAFDFCLIFEFDILAITTGLAEAGPFKRFSRE
jgi:hypothetical protein